MKLLRGKAIATEHPRRVFYVPSRAMHLTAVGVSIGCRRGRNRKEAAATTEESKPALAGPAQGAVVSRDYKVVSWHGGAGDGDPGLRAEDAGNMVATDPS